MTALPRQVPLRDLVEGLNKSSPIDVDEHARQNPTTNYLQSLQRAVDSLSPGCRLNDEAINVLLSRHVREGVATTPSTHIAKFEHTEAAGPKIKDKTRTHLQRCAILLLPYFDASAEPWSLYVYKRMRNTWLTMIPCPLSLPGEPEINAYLGIFVGCLGPEQRLPLPSLVRGQVFHSRYLLGIHAHEDDSIVSKRTASTVVCLLSLAR